MHKTVVINAVGLSGDLLGEHTPRLEQFRRAGALARITPPLPAVTTTVQASYLTGVWPAHHGIVGNGWYFRDECEIRFWRQSNRLVQHAKIWEEARKLDPAFTCANLFWWYNMYSSVNVAVTPRPMYPADGRKIPDIYTRPAALRWQLQRELGQFPLFEFWGPATSIRSTRWIAEAAMFVERQFSPTLTLIYLPHLDYALQRMGPDPAAIAADLRELDDECGRLIDFYKSRGAGIIVLSDYGIVPVSRPVHLNRVLRQAGLLEVREELGRELLDAGTSAAFAVADHQVAHVYVNDRSRMAEVRKLIEHEPGVACVLDEAAKQRHHLDHERSGELVALSEPDAWFTYYYWLDDSSMPDFARTVDIHRKPGYDPAELFIDPRIRFPRLRVAWTLLKRRLGFRSLLEIVAPSGELVRGSHGLLPRNDGEAPLLISDQPSLLEERQLQAVDVFGVILRHLMH